MFTTHRLRKLGLATLALAIIPILAACSSPQGTSTEPAGETGNAVNIAYLGFTLNGDYQAGIIRGLESVVAENGGTVTGFSADFDAQKQVSQCQDAITSGRYDGILIEPVDSVASSPCAAAALAAGIPLVTTDVALGEDAFSLDIQVEGVLAVIVTPRATQAAVDAELVKGACANKNPCNVIAEVAGANDTLTNTRVDDLEKTEGVVVVQRFATAFDPGEVTRALPDLLIAHPDVDVFLSASDISAVTASTVIASAGLSDQIQSIGLGGSREGIKAITDGVIYGTTGSWPETQGAFAATAITQAVAGETVSPVSLDQLKAHSPNVITIDNVEEFTAEWGAAS